MLWTLLGHAYLGMSLKPFNKLAVRALSSLKHSGAPRVLNLMKHSCSFIKHYLMNQTTQAFRRGPEGNWSIEVTVSSTYSVTSTFLISDCMVLAPSLNLVTALSKYSEIKFRDKLSAQTLMLNKHLNSSVAKYEILVKSPTSEGGPHGRNLTGSISPGCDASPSQGYP